MARKDQPVRPKARLAIYRLWLKGLLTPDPMLVRDLRKAAEAEGDWVKNFYQAGEALGVEEYLVDERKWWKLPEAS